MGACVHDLEGAVGKIILRNFPLCCCRVGQQRAGEGQEAHKGFRRLTRGLSRRASRAGAGAGASSPLVCSWRGLPKAPPGEAACLARKILIILVNLIFLGLFFIMVKCSCQLRASQTPGASHLIKHGWRRLTAQGVFHGGCGGLFFSPCIPQAG